MHSVLGMLAVRLRLRGQLQQVGVAPDSNKSTCAGWRLCKRSSWLASSESLYSRWCTSSVVLLVAAVPCCSCQSHPMLAADHLGALGQLDVVGNAAVVHAVAGADEERERVLLCVIGERCGGGGTLS